MLELYHWEPNIHFLKPLVALEEAQVPFTARYFDPTSFEQFSPSFPQNTESALQLEREGPVLVDGVTVLSSSFFLLEYIADAYPAANLYPGGSYDNYRARAWGQFTALQLAPIVCALGSARYLAPILKSREPGLVQAHIERIEPVERRAAWQAVVQGLSPSTLEGARMRLAAILKRYEDALPAGGWLAGSRYSIADIDAYAMLDPLTDLAPEALHERATPRILEFLSRVRARKAVQAALARTRTGKPREAYVPGAEPSRWG